MRTVWSIWTRASGTPDPNVTQDEAAPVWECTTCRSLRREPSGDVESTYRDDRYGREALDHLWDRCTREYEADRDWLVAQGLRPAARVLEIGSYTGAFCAFAEARGCFATGVDVSAEMVAYARERGVDAHLGAFDPSRFDGERFDSVWVLNCFEQLPDLHELLEDVRAVLAPGGRLVIRTPNAAFVRMAHRPTLRTMLTPLAITNHVLGVPFSRCLSAAALHSLLARHGFAEIVVRPREFAAVDPPELPAWWTVLRPVRRVVSGVLPMPWLDLTAQTQPSSERTASIVSASAGVLSER